MLYSLSPKLLLLFTFSFPPVCPECLSRSLHVPPRSSEVLSGPSLCSRGSPGGCLFWFSHCHHLTQQVPRSRSASSSAAPTHCQDSGCVHPASSNYNLTPSPRAPPLQPPRLSPGTGHGQGDQQPPARHTRRVLATKSGWSAGTFSRLGGDLPRDSARRLPGEPRTCVVTRGLCRAVIRTQGNSICVW